MANLGLKTLDYAILRSKDWINDSIVYAAQKLLKQHFAYIDGFQDTHCGPNSSFRVLPLDGRYVQILHADGNHWVTVSNIDLLTNKGIQDRALVFYSKLPKKLSLDLKRQICSFVRPSAKTFMFDILNIMPQTNSYDCGIFSIANATELLYGRNPLKCVWDIPKMRSHLIRCFEQGRMREQRIPFGSSI